MRLVADAAADAAAAAAAVVVGGHLISEEISLATPLRIHTPRIRTPCTTLRTPCTTQRSHLLRCVRRRNATLQQSSQVVQGRSRQVPLDERHELVHLRPLVIVQAGQQQRRRFVVQAGQQQHRWHCCSRSRW